jgi:hypothetical protein
MSTATDWISALANVTVAGSIVFFARQATSAASAVKESQKQREEDHLRSRREGAVNLLLKWSDTVSVAATCAMYVVNSLDQTTASDFKACLPVRISARHGSNLLLAMAGVPSYQLPKFENEMIPLDHGAVVEVGKQCKRYIDLLEVMLIG